MLCVRGDRASLHPQRGSVHHRNLALAGRITVHSQRGIPDDQLRSFVHHEIRRADPGLLLGVEPEQGGIVHPLRHVLQRHSAPLHHDAFPVHRIIMPLSLHPSQLSPLLHPVGSDPVTVHPLVDPVQLLLGELRHLEVLPIFLRIGF